MDEVKRGKVTAQLSTRQLHHHPKNPRKNLGDLTELTESIKKNGIMQNLTVIPGYYDEDAFINSEEEYTVIIGHRRLEAAKAAGLTEVPCRIYKNLPENDQIATMLEENMQRNDLTIYEQAQSFQLMLDLGETVDTLSEKTGFAKSTIYHRLNIAKLDPEKLKKKEDDEYFQITIKDLIELEKIEDVKLRNKILDEARDSRDLKWRVQSTVKAEQQKKKEKLVVDALKALGVKPGKDEDRWSYKYKQIGEVDLDELKEGEGLENGKLKGWLDDDVIQKITHDTVYFTGFGRVYIKNLEEIEIEDDDDDYETDEEPFYVTRANNSKRYSDIESAMLTRLHEFVCSIIQGSVDEIDKKDIPDVIKDIAELMIYTEANISGWELIGYLYGDPENQEEEDEQYEKFEKLPTHQKLLVWLGEELGYGYRMINYDNSYNTEKARDFKKGLEIFERYGWSLTDEEQELVDGTHELYKKEDE